MARRLVCRAAPTGGTPVSQVAPSVTRASRPCERRKLSSAFILLPSSLDFRLPALAVFAAPQGLLLCVAGDLVGFGVEVDGAAGAPGDVAEVAGEGAAVAEFDVGVGALAAAGAVEEVVDVLGVAAVAGDGFLDLPLVVEHLVAAAVDDDGAVAAVEGGAEAGAFEAERVAAAALPDDHPLVREVVGDAE